MKSRAHILLAALITVKILLGSLFIYGVKLDPLFFEGDAIAAEEAQQDPEGMANEGENIVEAQQDPEGMANEGENIIEEEKIDLNFLLKKKAELKREEEELARKRAELMAIQEELNNKFAILTQLRNEIKAEMARKKTVEEKKLKHLIKAYSAMKPQKAASLIEKLDMRFAIELLSRMKGDVVGNILTFVDIEKAAKISEQLATRK